MKLGRMTRSDDRATEPVLPTGGSGRDTMRRNVGRGERRETGVSYVSVLLLFIACWIAPRFRPRRGPPRSNEAAVIILFALFSVLACLAGSMQAVALVGKGGHEISARTATGSGLMWILCGAGLGLVARRAFDPRAAGPDAKWVDQLLLWVPPLLLMLLLWFFEVPSGHA